MKIIKKIIILIFVLAVLFIVLLHAYVNIKGKELVARKLADFFQREVSVGSVKAHLPLNVVVKNIDVKDLFKIEKAFAVGGALDIFRKDFTLYQLTLQRPSFYIIKLPPIAGIPVVSSEKPEQIVEMNVTNTSNSSTVENLSLLKDNQEIYQKQQKGNFAISSFKLRHFEIRDGNVKIIDKTVQGKEVQINLDRINVQVNGLEFPITRPGIVDFKLVGTIPWQNSIDQGRIDLSGWVNIFKKDIQAKLVIEGIDGVSLYPYYGGWIDLEKTRIQKAKLNFTSDIQGLDNDVTAQCSLKLTDIEFKPRSPEEQESRQEKIAQAVLGLLRSLNKEGIVLNFTKKTKFDSPDFGLWDIRSAFEDKLTSARKGASSSVLKVPAKVAQETVEGVSDLTRALVSGAVTIGQEIKKAVEGFIFKNEQKREEVKDTDVFSKIANKTKKAE
ncbi:MAG: DUF748 domain-containing protein [Candidatus Omnitrophica bacterium]|nr:DUF748 domain-containing protein [Candidatus Omnitrophota bacterium]